MESETTFVLVCEGCGTWDVDDDTGMVFLTDVKEHECDHLGNAELLRRIHEAKTSHRPYVRTEVVERFDDTPPERHEHVPEWAEDGWLDPPRRLVR